MHILFLSNWEELLKMIVVQPLLNEILGQLNNIVINTNISHHCVDAYVVGFLEITVF